MLLCRLSPRKRNRKWYIQSTSNIKMYFLKYIWVQVSKQKEKEALVRIQKNYFDDLEEKNVIETL